MFAATLAGAGPTSASDTALEAAPRRAPRAMHEPGVGNQAVLRRQGAQGAGAPTVSPVIVSQRTEGPIVLRDAYDDAIEAIEGEKLEISALLKRCEGLDPSQRDRMIGKIGGHAATTHEERQLASLLAVRFKGAMTRADFYNTYHELLERLAPDQATSVLDYVGAEVLGKTTVAGRDAQGEKTSVTVDKRSINDVGLKGAPGSSIFVGGVTYVVVDGGVQYKFKDLEKGGPAGRNNNPGNITVSDANPDAWDPAIGAYRGRNTDGRFAIFPTLERGKAAAKAWAMRSAKLSLLEYFNKYAPKSEPPNDPEAYADKVARHVSAKVAAKTGKPAGRGTVIADIVAADAMTEFVEGQIEAEGFFTDNIALVGAADPKLPQAVRDFVAGFDKATGGTNAVADKVAAAAAKENPP